MAATDERTTGLVDNPWGNSLEEQDWLGVTRYYRGLADFVATCATPMTIAIQGDWGSGKTSAVNRVRALLTSDSPSPFPDSAGFFRVNTWEYAQFGDHEELPILVLQGVLDALAPKSETAARMTSQLLMILAPMMPIVLKALASPVPGAGSLVADIVDARRDRVSQAESDAPSPSVAEQIRTLRQTFEHAVADNLKALGRAGVRHPRLVFFIDDLDRLPPVRAVEVMEILKVFLDCKDCVFILAVDFSVVARGVAQKFSAPSSASDYLDQRKARAFFDKIIQVPFALPVHTYDVDLLLSATLTRINMRWDEVPALQMLAKRIVRHSVGTNPRALKRLVNTFTLLSCIQEADGGPGYRADADSLLIFAVQACQAVFPAFHADLVKAQADDTTGLLQRAGDEGQLVDEASGELTRAATRWQLSAHEVPDFAQFATALLDLAELVAEAEPTRDGEAAASEELPVGAALERALTLASSTATSALQTGTAPVVSEEEESLFEELGKVRRADAVARAREFLTTLRAILGPNCPVSVRPQKSPGQWTVYRGSGAQRGQRLCSLRHSDSRFYVDLVQQGQSDAAKARALDAYHAVVGDGEKPVVARGSGEGVYLADVRDEAQIEAAARVVASLY